jgi:putative oxidoreductase
LFAAQGTPINPSGGLKIEAALLVRMSLGALLIAHGRLLKVFTFGPAGTVDNFHRAGYSGFFAYPVILGEIGGGLVRIVGLWTRAFAIALLPKLAGASM